MSRRVALEGSFAAAEAARMADVDVVAAYPITPQTHIVERLAEMVANGELRAAYIPVDSEHSAMSACSGASAAGARTFTATASQGFFLMHEVLYWVAAMNQPVVMAVCNRAVAPPQNIWADYSDAMTARDTGWIQLFAVNNQEVFDFVLAGFRLGEDPRVLLPVMVHLDGFTLTHVVEPVILPEQEEVNRFLPKYQHPFALNPDRPVSYAIISSPDIYSEQKKAQDMNLRQAKEVALEAWKEFGDTFGRYYSPIERYRCEGAKTLLMTMGSLSETAKVAIDKKRAAGDAVGLMILHLWRPFPFEELYEAVEDAELLIVFDRCISLGGPGGPPFSEVRSALFDRRKEIKVVGLVGALCGRNLPVEQFEEMINRGREIAEKGSKDVFETIGIRG